MKKLSPPASKILTLLAISLLLWTCSDVALVNKKLDQPDLTEAEMKRLVLLDENYVYPLDQAKANVLSLSSQFLDEKDGIKRSISKILTVPSATLLTRRR